jgi:hypothetical protein
MIEGFSPAGTVLGGRAKDARDAKERKKQMKLNDIIPSKYMKAHVDVPEEGTVTATVSGLTQESGQGDDGDYTINLLHFREHEKPLKLNVGMLKTMGELYGDETDQWEGKRVILFCTVQDFGGRSYNVIRIKNKNPDALNKTVVKKAAEAKDGEPPF